MTGPYEILIDDREARGAAAAALRHRPETRIEVTRLETGDYLVDDALLFERKTLMDLTLSIKDGRLFRQGLRLANAPRRGALILEGRASDLAGSGMRREAIQGALMTLTLFVGLPVLRAVDGEESAALMLQAAHQARAMAAGALPRRSPDSSGQLRHRQRLRNQLLQGLPGVGPTRAERLLARFGTVEKVMAASADDLAAVPGIGPTTAELIRWAVEERPARYGGSSTVTYPALQPAQDSPPAAPR